VPSGGANYHALFFEEAGLDVREDSCRTGEVDDDIGFQQSVAGKSAAALVFCGADYADLVMPLAGNVSNQRSCFSTA
jgi:hypothetical protein